MIKKLALVAVALAIAAPVFAGGQSEPPKKDEGGTTITNYGFVANNVATVANTGANMISAPLTLGRDKDREENSASIKTGAAYAYADVLGQANYTSIVCGTCSGSGKLVITNYGMVDNDVLTVANSGLNKANSGKIDTGAGSASSFVTGVVNTTIVGSVPVTR